MQISPVIMSYIMSLNQIFIKCDEKKYLSQFVSEMFDSLQEDSAKI